MSIQYIKTNSPYDGFITDRVSDIPTMIANLNQQTREKYVTDLAAISRGNNESKNPPARFKSLLKEAAPNSITDVDKPNFKGNASRPMEFCPIVITFIKLFIEEINDVGYFILPAKNKWSIDFYKMSKLSNFDKESEIYSTFQKEAYLSKCSFYNTILRHSYIDPEINGKQPDHIITLHTNLRCLINAGIPYDKIPFIDTLLYKIYRNGSDNFIHINGNKINIKNIDLSTTAYRWVKPKNSTTEYISVFIAEDNLEKLGITLDNIIFDINQGNLIVEHYEHFKALKMKIPMFVWSQFPMTHTKLSKESQSDRIAEGVGYWLPDDLYKKIEEFRESIKNNDKVLDTEELSDARINLIDLCRSSSGYDQTIDMFYHRMLTCWSQSEVQNIFKLLGYKREIWSRAPYYFKYKECIVTGWNNDSETWEHALLERGAYREQWKNWVQKETREIINIVKDIIYR